MGTERDYRFLSGVETSNLGVQKKQTNKQKTKNKPLVSTIF